MSSSSDDEVLATKLVEHEEEEEEAEEEEQEEEVEAEQEEDDEDEAMEEDEPLARSAKRAPKRPLSRSMAGEDDDEDDDQEAEEEDDDDYDDGDEEDEDDKPVAGTSKSPADTPASANRSPTPSAADFIHPADQQLDDDRPSFATALGLHRVGTKPPPRPQPQLPIQVLNARGMPARIRKKNKLFYDEETIVNELPQARAVRGSPVKRPNLAGMSQATQNSQPSGSRQQQQQQQQQSPQKPSPSKQQQQQQQPKKRKTVVSRYMQLKAESQQRKQLELAAAQAKAAAAAAAISPRSAAVVAAVDHERRAFERLGLRLRNLLKLPKAHRWVSYEWFYSYIDAALFAGDNDFQICLRESFPQLQTRKLTRAEWSRCRQLMGRPRRCSPAFFAEERAELERRRHRLRVMQSSAGRKGILGKEAQAEYIRVLPAEIPLALPVGTKVSARLRYPQDGIFGGRVAAVDSLSSSYRIDFDRAGLGIHTVPDFEIVALDYSETLQVTATFAQEAAVREQMMRCRSSGGAGGGSGGMMGAAAAGAMRRTMGWRNDPLLGSEIYNNSRLSKLMAGSGGEGGQSAASTSGGGGSGGGSSSHNSTSAVAAAIAASTGERPKLGAHHFKLLELIIRAKKTLNAKEMKLLRLKNMNAEAEMWKSFAEPLPDDYQRRYASIVIGMEKLNRDMHDYLGQMQSFTPDLTRDPAVAATMVPSYMRERCRELAVESVRKNNTAIKDESMLRMITDLAQIMWVASNMSAGNERMSQVNRVLEMCLTESKGRLLDAANVEVFQSNVQVHMLHLENDMRMGGAQLGAAANRMP